MAERSRTLRLIGEGAAIVISILLAFAIDAWWDARGERDHEEMLLRAIHAEFASNAEPLERYRTIAGKSLRGTSLFRDAVAESSPGATIVVPDSLILAVIGTPTFDPLTASLDAALASGDIELIRNAEIRRHISEWRQRLADTSEDEAISRQHVADRLVPLLSEQVRLGGAFERTLEWSVEGQPAGPQTHSVTVTRELEGALEFRRFFVSFISEGLEALEQTRVALLAAIEAELPPRRP